MRTSGRRKTCRPGSRNQRFPQAAKNGPTRWSSWAVWTALLLGLLPGAASAGEPLPAPLRPNILLVVADDVGIENVGCYQLGKQTAPTPTIDRLARRGLLFRCAWSNPVCSATRAGIHTGRHGFRTGVGFVVTDRNDNATLPSGEQTLPGALTAAGYACGLIGKWHLGHHDNSGADSPLRGGWSFHSGSLDHQFKQKNSYFEWTKYVNGHAVQCNEYATTVNVDDALQWIGRQKQPWFCCVAFNAAHSPWHAPPRHLHSFDLQCQDPRRNPRPFFLAAVEAMDTELGRLLAGLGPELDNTTVIFVSDNGSPGRVVGPPFAPVHKRFKWGRHESVWGTVFEVLTDAHRAKGTVYEAGVHVPLIIAGRHVRDPGRESHGLVHSLDLFATIIELAGVHPVALGGKQQRLDSVSLVPYLQASDTPNIRPTLYTEIFLKHPSKRGAVAIRDERYKLVRDHWLGAVEYELYDLQRDPLEQHDLWQGGRCDVAAEAAYCRLHRELEQLWASEYDTVQK